MMSRLFFLLVLGLLATSAAAEKPSVYHNREFGFKLEYPTAVFRDKSSENGPISLMLRSGTATFILGAGRSQPGQNPKKLAESLIESDHRLKAVSLDGRPFYRSDFTRMTPGGKPTERTLFFHYQPKSGFTLTILLTSEKSADPKVRQRFLNIVRSLRFVTSS